MNRIAALLVILALALFMLTPLAVGVNSPSVNTASLWADGGGPAPPFPWSIGNTSSPIRWADGGGPAPPFPWATGL
jgi:hypothetical protein